MQRIASLLPVLRTASVTPVMLRSAARAYGNDATSGVPRHLLPRILPNAASSLFGPDTSYVIQLGNSVFQILPPSESDVANPTTIYDRGFCGDFPPATGGLVLWSFKDGSFEQVAHLSIKDYATHMKTHGRPTMPTPGGVTDHWPRLQAGLFASDGCGFITLFDGEGTKFWWKTTYAMKLLCLKSSGANYMKYDTNASDGLVFETRVNREVMERLRVGLRSHYVLKKEILGKGTESTVYHGYCIVDEHSAAVKELKHAHYMEPMESFILKHSRMATPIRPLVTSWKDDNGKTYLALKLYNRTFLEELQLEKIFDVDIRNLYFLDKCETIKILHDKKFLNRDISIYNFLVTEEGDVVLADLGYGEVMQDGDTGTPMLNRGMSCIWCAPELIDPKETLTVQAEIYPLGILYLVDMTEGIGLLCIEDFVKSFVLYTRRSEWRKNALRAFRNSKFAKNFHGDPNILVSMVSRNPDLRPNLEDLMQQISQGTKP